MSDKSPVDAVHVAATTWPKAATDAAAFDRPVTPRAMRLGST
jgi:hypothetical protein